MAEREVESYPVGQGEESKGLLGTIKVGCKPSPWMGVDGSLAPAAPPGASPECRRHKAASPACVRPNSRLVNELMSRTAAAGSIC